MARERGFVYYEADATMGLTNPFVDIFVDNPTMAMFSARALKVSVGVCDTSISSRTLSVLNWNSLSSAHYSCWDIGNYRVANI